MRTIAFNGNHSTATDAFRLWAKERIFRIIEVSMAASYDQLSIIVVYVEDKQ
jgi:hypothetical protein